MIVSRRVLCDLKNHVPMEVLDLELEVGRNDGLIVDAGRALLDIREDDENDSKKAIDE